MGWVAHRTDSCGRNHSDYSVADLLTAVQHSLALQIESLEQDRDEDRRARSHLWAQANMIIFLSRLQLDVVREVDPAEWIDNVLATKYTLPELSYILSLVSFIVTRVAKIPDIQEAVDQVVDQLQHFCHERHGGWTRRAGGEKPRCVRLGAEDRVKIIRPPVRPQEAVPAPEVVQDVAPRQRADLVEELLQAIRDSPPGACAPEERPLCPRCRELGQPVPVGIEFVEERHRGNILGSSQAGQILSLPQAGAPAGMKKKQTEPDQNCQPSRPSSVASSIRTLLAAEISAGRPCSPPRRRPCSPPRRSRSASPLVPVTRWRNAKPRTNSKQTHD